MRRQTGSWRDPLLRAKAKVIGCLQLALFDRLPRSCSNIVWSLPYISKQAFILWIAKIPKLRPKHCINFEDINPMSVLCKDQQRDCRTPLLPMPFFKWDLNNYPQLTWNHSWVSTLKSTLRWKMRRAVMDAKNKMTSSRMQGLPHLVHPKLCNFSGTNRPIAYDLSRRFKTKYTVSYFLNCFIPTWESLFVHQTLET